MYTYGNMYLINSYKFGGGAPPPIDPDAQAFLTAAAITDPTITSAIDTLVVQLKADSIWTKMKAIYPFVGGTAASHKFNLKDPQDTDAAFRLVFNGGWTHSANGALPNGTNGWANTYLVPLSILTESSKHLSFYLRSDNTPINVDPVDMGSFSSGGGKDFLLSKRTAQIGMLSNILVSNTQTEPRGLSLITRTGTTNKLFKGNNLVNVVSGTGISAPFNVYIGALNLAAPYGYTNNEFAFASIGDGLTDTEESNLYTAAQNFNTTLARQI